MDGLWFWKGWPRPYNTISAVAFSLIVASLLFYLTAFAFGKSWVLPVETFHDQKSMDILVRNVEVGPFIIPVFGQAVYFFEFYAGGDIDFLPMAHYVSLGFFAIILCLFLSFLTALDKIPYYVGMGIFIGLILLLRPDDLGFALPWPQAAAMICLLSYVPLSFYFFAFRKGIPFLPRLVVFGIVTLLLLSAVSLFSLNEGPLLRLSVLTLRPLVLVAMLFIALIAHQVVALFVFAVSYSAKSGKSLNHFLIITAIYLLNLWLVYWSKVRFIPWDISPINEFILLPISAIIGIWGYAQQEPTYGNLYLFRPWGFLFYTCLAVATFTVTGTSFLEYNDPVVSLIEDWTLFTHLAFSLIFLLYVISNFIGPLAQNLPIHRVLYMPNRMPYITYRLAGIAALLAFVFYNNWHTLVFKTMAGHYNALGDVEKWTGNDGKSEAYYRVAAATYLNHHANYNLASKAGMRSDFARQQEYLQNATYVPSLELHLNRSNAHRMQEEWFRAQFALHEAQEEFSSPYFWNNLGYLHALIGADDSARMYLTRALQHQKTKAVAQTNLTALALQERNFADSVPVSPTAEHSLLAANLTALGAGRGRTNPASRPLLSDTILNSYTAAWLGNFLLGNRSAFDTALVTSAKNLARKPVNDRFAEDLLYGAAITCYENGNVAEAFRILSGLMFRWSDARGKYQTTMGIWSLDQRQYDKAVEHLEEAVSLEDADAYYPLAVARTEAGLLTDALPMWDSLSKSSDSTLRTSSLAIHKVLAHQGELSGFTDYELYLYSRYRAATLQEQSTLMELVTSPELKVKFLLESLEEMIDSENETGQQMVYGRLSSVSFRGDRNIHKVKQLELRLAALASDTAAVQALLPEAEIEPARLQEMIYYNLMANGPHPDTSIRRKEYEILGRNNFYFPEGILASAKFFSDTYPETHEAYSLLVDATQANPGSIGILKAYILEAARIGYSGFAEQGLRMLEEKIGPAKTRAFRNAHPHLEEALIEYEL